MIVYPYNTAHTIRRRPNPSTSLYITNGYIPILSIKAKKNLIVKKAKIAEILNPINKLTKLITSKELKLSISKNVNAPSMVGILSKNANLDASFKLRPIRRAAVIAVPDLEAPGIKANT